MSGHIELVHTEDNSPQFNMPYTPAVKVRSGKTMYLAGVTAAPVYHSHPHDPAEFATIPVDAQRQAEMCMENLAAVLKAGGARLTDVVDLTRYIVNLEANQDAINLVMGLYLGAHRPATTTVEVVRLATDPRLVLELRAVAVTPE